MVVLAIAIDDDAALAGGSERMVAGVLVPALSAAGVAGVLALAIVGPWRARVTATLVFALLGVAGAAATGLEIVGGRLAPASLVVVAALALAHHLLASPELADEGR
jgi:hypothetical protein